MGATTPTFERIAQLNATDTLLAENTASDSASQVDTAREKPAESLTDELAKETDAEKTADEKTTAEKTDPEKAKKDYEAHIAKGITDPKSTPYDRATFVNNTLLELQLAVKEESISPEMEAEIKQSIVEAYKKEGVESSIEAIEKFSSLLSQYQKAKGSFEKADVLRKIQKERTASPPLDSAPIEAFIAISDHELDSILKGELKTPPESPTSAPASAPTSAPSVSSLLETRINNLVNISGAAKEFADLYASGSTPLAAGAKLEHLIEGVNRNSKPEESMEIILRDLRAQGINWNIQELEGQRAAYKVLEGFHRDFTATHDPELLTRSLTEASKRLLQAASASTGGDEQYYLATFREKFQAQYKFDLVTYQKGLAYGAEYLKNRKHAAEMPELSEMHYREHVFGNPSDPNSLLERLRAASNDEKNAFKEILNRHLGKNFLIDFQEGHPQLRRNMEITAYSLHGNKDEGPLPKALRELAIVGEAFYPSFGDAQRVLTKVSMTLASKPSADRMRVMEDQIQKSRNPAQAREVLAAIAPKDIVPIEDLGMATAEKEKAVNPTAQKASTETSEERARRMGAEVDTIVSNFRNGFNPTHLNGLERINLQDAPHGMDRRLAARMTFGDYYHQSVGVSPIIEAQRHFKAELDQKLTEINPRNESKVKQALVQSFRSVINVAAGIYGQQSVDHGRQILEALKTAETKGDPRALASVLSTLDAKATQDPARQAERTYAYEVAMQLDQTIVKRMAQLPGVTHPTSRHSLEIAQRLNEMTNADTLNLDEMAAYVEREGNRDPVAARMALIVFNDDYWSQRKTGMSFMQFLSSAEGVANTQASWRLRAAFLQNHSN